MDSMFFGLVIGFLLAVILWFATRRRRRGKRGPDVNVGSSVEAIRSVGELVVLKVFTKQIVTSKDHLFGDWGERWLPWLLSSKQAAIVFEFVVDFRYDLRSPMFKAESAQTGTLAITMPPAIYEIHLKGMQIYDEQDSAFVPILLPEWIGRIFGGKLTVKEKNQLFDAAKREAEGLAGELSRSMITEVQTNAEATIGSMVRGMGFKSVGILFADEASVGREIDLSVLQASVEAALTEGLD